MSTQALQIALPSQRLVLDYRWPKEAPSPTLGQRVRVPFGKKSVVGFVVDLSRSFSGPVEKIKAVEELFDERPPQASWFSLIQWAAHYYHENIAEVLFFALPQYYRLGKDRTARPSKTCSESPTSPVNISLNHEQTLAVTAISKAHHFQTFLLDGITGSGKTEVYAAVMQKKLLEGKQVLMLVPEIGLTGQLEQRLQTRLGVSVTTLHSGLTDKIRYQNWSAIRTGEAQLILGTRSACFAEIPNLGLIVVDEEHDLSFKQQDGFRYSARDIAVKGAQLARVPIILGSATPSLESLRLAMGGQYQHLKLRERGLGQSTPSLSVIDIRHKKLTHGLSAALIEKIKHTLSDGGQAMLFINRRGYAPVILCYECGWMGRCPNCDVQMTYHRKQNRLRCHHCDRQQTLPKSCPGCNTENLHPVGEGTQKIEEGLQALFPETPIYRIDRDAIQKKSSFEKTIHEILEGKPAVLVGTQMLAKGHDFPNLRLVGLLDIDGGLFSQDFRAPERLAQLITQVAGRAGRREIQGTVILQTTQANHPYLQELLDAGYEALARTLLKEREMASLPPFTHWAMIRAEHKNEETAMRFLENLKTALRHDQVDISDPFPPAIEKRLGRFRAQIICQAASRPALHTFANTVHQALANHRTARLVRASLEIDPLETA